MKTHVEFRSSSFPACDGEEDEINPGRWGKRLAQYLKSKIEDENIPTDEIYTEDWGVALPIKNDKFPMWIGCGNYKEHEDGFLCFIEPSKPTVRRWLRQIDTTARVTQIAGVLNKILLESPEIRDVRWWDENEERG